MAEAHTVKAVSPAQAAELLSVSTSTIRNWIRDGRLKSSQPGKRRHSRRGGARHLIPMSAIDELLTTEQAASPAEKTRAVYTPPVEETVEAKEPDEPMWTRKEAAAATGLSVQTIRRREGKGLTPYTDGGQIVRYRASEVLRMFKPKSREAYEAKKEDGDE